MKRDFIIQLSVISLFAFLGGFCAQLAFQVTSTEAASADNNATYVIGNNKSLSSLAWKNGTRVTQLFYDEHGQGRLDFGIYGDQPMQNFYGDDGQVRLQIGTYPGTYCGSGSAARCGGADERGLPMMGFSDNSGNLKMLFRLAGTNQSPVIIMKDNQHRDRVVMGLSLNEAKQEPFLATFDNDGNKKLIYGDY